MKLKCVNCMKKTPHGFKGNLHVIRETKPRRAIPRRRFGGLRGNEYHLYVCSIYQCMDCGRRRKLFKFLKKTTKRTAERSKLEIFNNFDFWHFIYN